MNIASKVKITLINIDRSPKFSKSQVAIDSLVASFNISRKRNARHKLVSRRTRDRYEIADLIAASPTAGVLSTTTRQLHIQPFG
jgi:hypothetical protein